ncbi:MAG: hypothetical protein CMH57_11150 [Myxococcales bacterium]|nr:hypothetical protein [Myxococcales bacterium]
MFAAYPIVGLKPLGMLREGDVETLLLDDAPQPRALLLQSRSGFWSMLTDPDHPAPLRALLDRLDWSRPLAFAGLWEPLLPLLSERAEITWRNPCHQHHLTPTEAVEAQLRELRGDVAQLGRPRDEHAPLLLEHWPYGASDDPEALAHIRERISNARTSGWFEGDALISWAMTHRDGSPGFMHTLAPHRRRGVGLRVAADLLLQVITAGWIPFCHVVEGNKAPMGMIARFGFKRSPDRYLWLGTSP